MGGGFYDPSRIITYPTCYLAIFRCVSAFSLCLTIRLSYQCGEVSEIRVLIGSAKYLSEISQSSCDIERADL